MTTRELFIQQKDLRDKLVAVVKQDWFLQCLAYAKAELMDSHCASAEELAGARAFESVLLTIGDEPDKIPPLPTSGLLYQEPVRKTDQQRKK